MTKVFIHIKSGDIFLQNTRIIDFYGLLEDEDGFLFSYKADKFFEIGEF